jgi:hypothetical protein
MCQVRLVNCYVDRTRNEGPRPENRVKNYEGEAKLRTLMFSSLS